MRQTVISLGLFMFANSLLGTATSAGEPTLRVMTFNIRYAAAADGENGWDKRKDFLIDVIRKFNPDLLGTQEVLAVQADFLAERLKDYTLVGVGRDDGKRRGEFSSVMFRTSRFELVDSGTFWLSETPDRPGSKSWDSSLPRIATWARLRDRDDAGRDLCYLNTHWDHRGNQARVESAKIIRRWISEHAGAVPTIVTGDFNVSEDHEGFRTIVAKPAAGPRLFDLYRQVHPNPEPDEATFHNFSGNRRGKRIDFVLGSAECRATEATIDRASQNDRYPSDHFPVSAVLTVQRPPSK